MNKPFLSILALAGLLSASGARAQDAFYAGATVSTAGDLTATRNGVRENSDHHNALKIFGGYQFNEYAGMEAGYTDFGDFKFNSGPRIGLHAGYLAAKGSIPLGSSFSLFGKAGLAFHKQKVEGLGALDGSYHKTKPMFSIGTAWHLSKNVSLTAEVANYGSVKNQAGVVKARTLEAGLHYTF